MACAASARAAVNVLLTFSGLCVYMDPVAMADCLATELLGANTSTSIVPAADLLPRIQMSSKSCAFRYDFLPTRSAQGKQGGISCRVSPDSTLQLPRDPLAPVLQTPPDPQR